MIRCADPAFCKCAQFPSPWIYREGTRHLVLSDVHASHTVPHPWVLHSWLARRGTNLFPPWVSGFFYRSRLWGPHCFAETAHFEVKNVLLINRAENREAAFSGSKKKKWWHEVNVRRWKKLTCEVRKVLFISLFYNNTSGLRVFQEENYLYILNYKSLFFLLVLSSCVTS